MRRRAFVALVGAAAGAGRSPRLAQQSDRVRRVGVLMGYAEGLGRLGRGVPGGTPKARVDGRPQH